MYLYVCTEVHIHVHVYIYIQSCRIRSPFVPLVPPPNSNQRDSKKIKLKNALQLKSRMHNYRQLTVYFPRALWSGDVAYVGVEQRVQLFVSA